jgi:hypothetical protein
LSWLVVLQNERGDELRRAPEPLDAIETLLPVEDEAFPYLSYLDPYGNTIFNRTQMKPFLAEWRRLYEREPSEGQRRLLRGVEDIAEECARTVHTFVRFIGTD